MTTRFGIFRHAPVTEVAAVPTTPTLQSANLCDMLSIPTHKEDQRLHAITPVLLPLSDKDLPSSDITFFVVYYCNPIFPSLFINTHFQTPQFEMASICIFKIPEGSVLLIRKIINAKRENVHLAFWDVHDNLILALTE